MTLKKRADGRLVSLPIAVASLILSCIVVNILGASLASVLSLPLFLNALIYLCCHTDSELGHCSSSAHTMDRSTVALTGSPLGLNIV